MSSDEHILGELTATTQSLKTDVERLKTVLEQLQQLGPSIERMASSVDTTREVNTQLSHTVARLGAVLDGLVQDLSEVRSENYKLRTDYNKIKEELNTDRVFQARSIERLAPIWAAVVAAAAAVWMLFQ